MQNQAEMATYLNLSTMKNTIKIPRRIEREAARTGTGRPHNGRWQHIQIRVLPQRPPGQYPCNL